MTTYSTVKHQEKNSSIPNTSTPNHHVQLIGTKSVRYFNLNTTAKLPPAVKDYVCFKIDGKSAQVAKCVKSRIMTKVIDCVISIDKSEQKCVVIKVMLQSPLLKYHVKNISINQSLRSSTLFEHICLLKLRNYKNMLENVITNNN